MEPTQDEIEMNNTFICAECAGIFEKARSEEEAIAEKEKLFPDIPLKDCVQVCHDCFIRIMLEHDINP